jgi:hypothetical protein
MKTGGVMKHEWRKHEKNLYLPKEKPETVLIPKFKFLAISGSGNPNGEDFSKCVEALYSVSYGVKMSYKLGIEPDGYFDYTVYPLEGVWDLSDEGKETFEKTRGLIDKDKLKYTIMIRQPEFVTEAFIRVIIERVKIKKPNSKLDEISLEEDIEGKCVQILHVGSYDDERRSFVEIENFCKVNGLSRVGKIHREIYLSDARKVALDKLKTVLRIRVE